MANWIIQPFGNHHERASFSCGRPSLDNFIHVLVSQYEKRSLGRTFVATVPDETRVVGYYTLAAGAIAFAQLPADASRKLPKHPVPIVLLGRLAVDASAQGKRLGETLLLDALQRSLDLSDVLGIHAVEVNALDDLAAAFYRKYGFTPLLDNPLHLFLPMTIVERVLR